VLLPGGRGPAAAVPQAAAAIADERALRRQVLRTPALWAQATIVFAAYVGYKGMDDVALFAVDAWGYDEVESARLVAWITWMRPLACVVAGLISDRVRASTVLPLAFSLVAAGEAALWLVPGDVGIAWLFAVDALTVAAAVFALRAVYFALFAEARIPMAATGAAIGAVSVVGFLPELFVNAAGGALIDAAPGGLGHQRFAGCLAAAALVGVVASLAFRRLARRS
ncbi:MAG: hypothetical protein KC486_04985, partial [Myxococcales bacterium]|nr:hypothetical protein [Myxococcales bacterium]